MRRYKLFKIIYGTCAVTLSVLLLFAALIATAASHLGMLPDEPYSGIGGADPPGAVETGDRLTGNEETALSLIHDPGGTYALEFYDALFYTEEGENHIKGDYTIISRDLSASNIGDMFNETPYKPDINALLEKYKPVSAQNKSITTLKATTAAPPVVEPEPLVLIIHTHGTEGYAAPGATSYSMGDLPRSTDINQNITAVGRSMRDAFVKNGIPALHCEIMHDKESYNSSYRNSLATILSYLAKYPSIKYVFDVHRDALLGDGVMTKCVCELDGTASAQVMFVVGSDAGGAKYPDWQKNLAFALSAQLLASERYPGLMRPISLRKASFNAQYAYRGLLIEVGSCANTLAEAKTAGAAIADVLSELIFQGV